MPSHVNPAACVGLVFHKRQQVEIGMLHLDPIVWWEPDSLNNASMG